MARNRAVFQDKPSTPELVAHNCTNILSYFPQKKNPPVPRIISEEVINKQKPWAYFDGASQNEDCRGGAILHMTENHHYKIQMGVGGGSNNFPELCALKLLLCFAREKNCTHLQIFSDSMIITNWINKGQICHNLLLNAVLTETPRLLEELDTFSCRHVYGERNVEADQLPKIGLTIPHEHWKILEQINGTFHEYYHMPFIDKLDQINLI